MALSLTPSISNLSSTKPKFEALEPSRQTPQSAENSFEPSASRTPAASNNLCHELREFGLSLLSQTRSIGRSIPLAQGLALGLRLEGSLHTKSSALVSQNPFRLASTILLEKKFPRQSIVWTQTGGVAELGFGLNGTLPLAQFVGLQGGFNPSTLLRYRCIEPHKIGFLESNPSALESKTTLFPFSSRNVLNLPAGAEYEISGQGKISVNAALVTNLGTPVGTPVSVGVGASVFGNATKSHELALNVLALDGENRVRVTIRQLDGNAEQIGAKAYAGVITELASQNLGVGNGILNAAATVLGQSSIDALVNYYSTFSVQKTLSTRNQDTVIATFDLDLSKPDAIRAYDDLMKLSFEKAEALSMVKDSGVRQLKQVQNEKERRDEFSASLLGDKLLLFEALCNEKDGHFITPNGDKTLYRHAHFKKLETGWFEPSRDILWESVTLDPVDNEAPRSFFRCRYQKTGEFQGVEYDDFFKLADALSLPREDTVHGEHGSGERDRRCKQLFCAALEASQITDVYFTNSGIQKICNAGAEKALAACLKSMAKLRKEFDLPLLRDKSETGRQLRSLLAKHIAETKAGWLFNFGHFDRLAEWESKYAQLCGRSIITDAETYSNASEFANAVAQLKDAKDPKQLERFFVGLGKSKGFRYQAWIAALANLAGDKETLVHQHELSGNGVMFKYNDEGKLDSPSEIVTSLLSQAL